MSNMKKEKGITLVTLVITVVVMLIITGVVITIVINEEGISSKIRQVTESYKDISIYESAQIQGLINQTDKYLEEENGEEHGTIPKVGDFVNYSVVVDEVMYDKWRILYLDNNGNMEIVCYNGPQFMMSGRDDYANSIKILNDKSIPYGNGTYAVGTRHLGSNPTNPNDYETIPTNYVKCYSDYENISSDENYKYINQTHHESDIEALKSFWGTKKLEGEFSWLASRRAEGYPGYSSYYVNYIDGSATLILTDHYICHVTLSGYADAINHIYSLAPVVSLSSEIKLTGIKATQNGTESNPWQLSI